MQERAGHVSRGACLRVLAADRVGLGKTRLGSSPCLSAARPRALRRGPLPGERLRDCASARVRDWASGRLREWAASGDESPRCAAPADVILTGPGSRRLGWVGAVTLRVRRDATHVTVFIREALNGASRPVISKPARDHRNTHTRIRTPACCQ